MSPTHVEVRGGQRERIDFAIRIGVPCGRSARSAERQLREIFSLRPGQFFEPPADVERRAIACVESGGRIAV